jgi:hypothetical protein
MFGVVKCRTAADGPAVKRPETSTVTGSPPREAARNAYAVFVEAPERVAVPVETKTAFLRVRVPLAETEASTRTVPASGSAASVVSRAVALVVTGFTRMASV